MLSNWLRVDVFEILLQKKEKKIVGSLQPEKFLSRQTHLAVGWPSVLVRRSTKATSASDGGVATLVGRVRLDLWLEA